MKTRLAPDRPPYRGLRRTLAGALLGLAALTAQAGAYEDFFKAVSLDDAGGVQALLQRGFDPNARDERGQVPLYLSLREGSFKVAALLLQQPQTQVDAANAVGETPLMIAALRGQSDWARRLVDKGARINQAGWGPLHYAATGPDVALVGWLIERGAALDARSPNGSTPLMMAACYGNEDSAHLLLARGADAKLRNDKNLSAADFARLAGRDKLGEKLDQAMR
jgi:ankyrin repeat protein